MGSRLEAKAFFLSSRLTAAQNIPLLLVFGPNSVMIPPSFVPDIVASAKSSYSVGLINSAASLIRLRLSTFLFGTPP